jgi:hypothetical protein
VAVLTALCRKVATKAQFHIYMSMNGHSPQFCVDKKGRSGAFLLFLEIKFVFSAQPGSILK